MPDDEGPAEGMAWVPAHGFSQVVTWDGEAVVKQFADDAVERATVESTLLAKLAKLAPELPVPRLLPGPTECQVRTAFVDGVLGQEWVAAGRPATDPERVERHVTFMSHCGRALRLLHRVEADIALPGEGPVIVHGDFAPYNVIVGPELGDIRAVIDWELAHRGDRVEDLAWMEWNMRIWYSPQPGVLEAFYRAYGTLPPWSERHAAMLERCDRHVRRALRPSYPSEDARAQWLAHQDRTLGFSEIVDID